MTAIEAAAFESGASAKARENKARRRLDRLTKAGLVFLREGEPIGGRASDSRALLLLRRHQGCRDP